MYPIDADSATADHRAHTHVSAVISQCHGGHNMWAAVASGLIVMCSP